MNKLTKHTSFLDLKQANTLTKAGKGKKALNSAAELEEFFCVLQKNLSHSGILKCLNHSEE